MDDERIDRLITMLAVMDDGFANNLVLKPELLDLLREVKRERDRDRHCPGCDGDHL